MTTITLTVNTINTYPQPPVPLWLWNWVTNSAPVNDYSILGFNMLFIGFIGEIVCATVIICFVGGLYLSYLDTKYILCQRELNVMKDKENPNDGHILNP